MIEFTRASITQRRRGLPRAAIAALLALLPCGVLAAEAPWVGEDLSGKICEGGGQGYGPFDNTNPTHLNERLPVVERQHFTSKVSSLVEGESGGLLSDLDYTVRAFPNHHRALYSIIRLSGQERGQRMFDQWPTPPECYLQRAIHFAPEDHRLYILFGILLHQREHYERAEATYRRALELQPESPEAHYNLGLTLLERSAYEQARQHARKAYERGYPLPGLRERLSAAGYPP